MDFATHLQTARLHLRALVQTDTPFILGLIADDRVRQYLGGAVPAENRKAVAAGYFRVDKGHAVWLAETRQQSQPVGLIFISPHREGGEAELSFMFSPGVWGKGYATEATQGVLDHARRDIGLARVIAETQAANRASRALLQRLGMSESRRVHRFGAEQIIYST